MRKTNNNSAPGNQAIGRREFMRSVVAMLATTEAALGSSVKSNAREDKDTVNKLVKKPNAPVIGIQMGPHTMLDEGIEHVLDLIQDNAEINTVMIYSHSFHSNLRKPTQFLAPDHGVPLKETRNRSFPSIWVRTHNKYYADTSLKPKPVDSGLEHANRDLFAEIVEPARKRN